MGVVYFSGQDTSKLLGAVGSTAHAHNSRPTMINNNTVNYIDPYYKYTR